VPLDDNATLQLLLRLATRDDFYEVRVLALWTLKGLVNERRILFSDPISTDHGA